MAISSTQFSELQRSDDGRFHLAKKTFDGTLDPYMLLNELSEVKAINVKIYEDEIILNTDKKIPAIEELRTKTQALAKASQKLTNDLRVNYGSAQSYANSLNTKVASIKKADANTSVSIRADIVANATETDHKISISQVASKDYIKAGYVASSLTTALGFSGVLSLNNNIITISPEDTLSSVVDKINTSTDTSHVAASTLQTTENGTYVLVLESTDFAKSINFNGAPGTSTSFFGLVPASNTSQEALESSGDTPLTDIVHSSFTVSDPDAPVPLNGTLTINGQVFTITRDETTLHNIIDSINGNALTGATATLRTISENGITTYGITFHANTPGVPIDFSSTSSSLLGLLPATPNSSVSSNTFDTLSSGFTTTSASTAMEYNGTFTLNNKAITITSDMSLDTLISTINATEDINVVASKELVSHTTDTYYLKLTATTKGTAIDMRGTSATDSSLQGTLGLKLPSSNTDVDELIAKFTFDGIEMTRTSNSIKNLIPGVTFTLNTVSDGETIFSIEHLGTEGFNAINEFVTSYNDLVKTLSIHKKEKADGSPHPDAVLYGDRLITQIEFMLQDIQNSPSFGDSFAQDEYYGLSAIGIDFTTTKEPGADNVPGMMVLNKEKLIDCISNKPYVEIIKLFGNYATSSNPHFTVFDMTSAISSGIMGQEISVSYRYIGPTATDENYRNNFTMPQPTTPLGAAVAGKSIFVEYLQNPDNSFSALIYGIENQQTVRVDNIQDGKIVGPSNSIFKGLTLNFTGSVPPDVGGSIKAAVTLPSFQAILSCPGHDNVTVSNIQNNLIMGPKGSIYEGLTFGYTSSASSPLIMEGGALSTTLRLTQGIAVSFASALQQASAKAQSKEAATSLFDLSLEVLTKKNETNQKNIDQEEAAVERQKKAYEPLIHKLYKMNDTYSHLMSIIEKINAPKKQ